MGRWYMRVFIFSRASYIKDGLTLRLCNKIFYEEPGYGHRCKVNRLYCNFSAMKELLIIRHAKSSWANAFSGDFDRTLNDRGHRDAPRMAEKIKGRGVAIQAFLSSTANRALTTAVYFAEAYGKTKNATPGSNCSSTHCWLLWLHAC